MSDQQEIAVDTGVRAFNEVCAPRRGVACVVDASGRSGLYVVEAHIRWSRARDVA